MPIRQAATKSAPHSYRQPNTCPMTRTAILAKMAAKAGITKAQAEAAYDTLLAIAYTGAKQTGGITLPGLVKLSIGKRAPRVARNPSTGEKIRIPASKIVKAAVLKALRDAVFLQVNQRSLRDHKGDAQLMKDKHTMPKTTTLECRHCEADVSIFRNGKKMCSDCGEVFIVSGLPTRRTAKRPSAVVGAKRMVSPVHQPDDDSCGWATTKWVLLYFGALDVSDKRLREELNTDAKRGFRAWLRKLGLGDTLITQKGTLPKSIFDALSRRGIKMKNPVRLESPLEYIDYLNETFDEGGCAIMFLANTSILHWMGVDRVSRSRFRLMDPSRGCYYPFAKHVDAYRKQCKNTVFVVFGFVRRQ